MGKAMMMMILCFLLPFIFQICLMASAEVKHYDWDVEYMYWKPDCVEHLVMGINGKFPGPTIRAKAGDTVQVNLTNKLGTEGLVIHWHGIRQINTPWFDGTASISQCAIDVGESFVYNFTVDRAGTYFYHGHFGMQRSAGLYGSIVVDVADGEKEPFAYDGEINLLLSDWWHESVHEQEVGLSSKPFRWIGEPQSILINGKGQYNCSLGAKFLNDSATTSCSDTEMSPQCQPDIHSVDQNKTYRVRIASTTSLASINFAIGNHNMTLVEADGNYIQPVSVDSLNIYSGDTYSVLITTNQDPSTNYWISAYQIARKPPLPPPGLTILNYKPNPASDTPLSPPPVSPEWNDFAGGKSFANKIIALKSDQHPIPKPPTKFDRRIVLLNTQNTINGYVKWAINNVSLVLPTTPLIGSLKFGLKNAFDSKSPAEDFPATYDIMKPPVNPNSSYGNNLYNFDYNITIDVIIQNANVLSANVSEVHPWHLHGHDFWVLGYGDGKFSEENDGKTLNLDNPPLRNTVVIFPHGWTAIRFVTDNPGVWPFHCHIEPHLHMGMGVVFAEAVDKIKTIPDGVLTCGLTAKNGGLVGGSSSGPPVAAVSTHYLLFIYLFYVIYSFI